MPDGILLVDKPAGLTSHDVCSHIRRLAQTRKVGHTGTLDPMAEGLMILLLGKATRLNQFSGGERKTYEASILFGVRTDTLDTTGKVTMRKPPCFSLEQLTAALCALQGSLLQTPPMYSAKKVAGRKLYAYAREGKEIERRSVRVEVCRARLLQACLPDSAKVEFCVSKGTYIRSLIDELGVRLNTFAAMSGLRRTKIDAFTLEQANALDVLERSGVQHHLLSMDCLLQRFPRVVVHKESERFVIAGNPIYPKNIASLPADLTPGERVCIYGERGFLAMGIVEHPGDTFCIKPDKIFV